MVAEALQGLDSTFLLALLLSVLQTIVPRLLLARPLEEEVVYNHQNFIRATAIAAFLPPEASLKTQKRVSREIRGFVGGPGTLHQHPAEIAVPLACVTRTPLARAFVKPRHTTAQEAGSRAADPKVAHLHAASARIARATVASTPGILVSCSSCGAKGAMSSPI